MRKEILLLWFGDNKPKYVDWNVENFRKMNPTWEVKYIEYSKDKLLRNPETTNDLILQKALIEFNKDSNSQHMSHLVDKYKDIYLNEFNENGIVINLDLDCFPIAPLDNFFINSKVLWMCNGYNKRKYRGYWIVGNNLINTNRSTDYIQQEDLWMTFSLNNPIGDAWCYKDLATLQILKNVDLNKSVSYFDQFMINSNNIEQQEIIKSRANDFLNCNLEFGSFMCNPCLSPVEHFHQVERYKINDNNIK